MSEPSLVGTWRLVSFQTRDEEGSIAFPFGHDPVGFITYTADGQMSVQFGRAGLVGPEDGSWVGADPADIVAAARDYYAYCGAYEVRDGEVVHKVALSLMPNWMGGEQVRLTAFEGDRVTLATPPLPIGGRQQVATLVWERV
jgi:hypothetical protein